MPKIFRVSLTPAQRAEWNRRTREPGTTPRLRDRLEMVRLSDAGWTVPQIARHLGRHEQTVRAQVKAFLAGGFDALRPHRSPGRPPTVRADDLDALERLLDESAGAGRTWTLGQLTRWLGQERGVTVSPGRLRVLLKQRRFRWKRTKRTVRHKRRDPDLQAAKEAEREVLTS
ncbi:MAG: helix-turn-helix domain-containing protein [Chloroflexota bacterium]